MRKLKGGMRESKLFDTRIYPVVRLATKAHLHPCYWSTHKEYCFSATKTLPWTQSRSPWLQVPLRSFTKMGGGLHVPRTKMSSSLHTKPEGRWRCRRATKTPSGQHTEYKMWLSPRTKAQGTQPCSLTHSRANLTLTLTKHVLNLKIWSINTLVGLEVLRICVGLLWTPASFKWQGGGIFIAHEVELAVLSRCHFFCVGVG